MMAPNASLPTLHIFLSYAKKDTRDLALCLCDELNKFPALLTWMDKALKIGVSWPQQIQDEIAACDLMIVLLSPDVQRKSTDQQPVSFVIREVLEAQRLKKPIIPIVAQTTELPLHLVGDQYLDFTQDAESAWHQLLETLKRADAPFPACLRAWCETQPPKGSTPMIQSSTPIMPPITSPKAAPNRLPRINLKWLILFVPILMMAAVVFAPKAQSQAVASTATVTPTRALTAASSDALHVRLTLYADSHSLTLIVPPGLKSVMPLSGLAFHYVANANTPGSVAFKTLWDVNISNVSAGTCFRIVIVSTSATTLAAECGTLPPVTVELSEAASFWKDATNGLARVLEIWNDDTHTAVVTCVVGDNQPPCSIDYPLSAPAAPLISSNVPTAAPTMTNLPVANAGLVGIILYADAQSLSIVVPPQANGAKFVSLSGLTFGYSFQGNSLTVSLAKYGFVTNPTQVFTNSCFRLVISGVPPQSPPGDCQQTKRVLPVSVPNTANDVFWYDAQAVSFRSIDILNQNTLIQSCPVGAGLAGCQIQYAP